MPKMVEERPPTQEEIADLRGRVAAYTKEHGQDVFDPKDLNRVMTCDHYIGRFFLHCTEIPGNHLKNTEDMIFRSLKFRKEKDVNAIKSSDLDEGLKTKGSLYLRNRDVDGKQLLIFDVKTHIKGVAPVEDMRRMFLYFLERVDREDEDGMITIVFDCAGCGIKNMDMELIRYMIDVLKDYYPWNLNYILVLEMPWVLNAAWKIIKAWLPAPAVRKIKFVNKITMDEYVAPDQKFIAWGGSDPWEYEFVDDKPTMNGDSQASTPEFFTPNNQKKSKDPEGDSGVEMELKVAANNVSSPTNVTFSDSQLHAEYHIAPTDEIVFVKGPKGLMATISISNKTQGLMAFKIKTTSPERYRVRPSFGLNSALATTKVEIFYQPVQLDSDDYSDVLKDKFLVNMFKPTSMTEWKSEIKDLKPAFQHRLRASVKRSLLKTTDTVKKEAPVPQDVYIKELKALDARQRAMEEQLSSVLFYVRLTVLLTLIAAFCACVPFFWSNQTEIACSTFQDSQPLTMTSVPPIMNEEL